MIRSGRIKLQGEKVRQPRYVQLAYFIANLHPFERQLLFCAVETSLLLDRSGSVPRIWTTLEMVKDAEQQTNKNITI